MGHSIPRRGRRAAGALLAALCLGVGGCGWWAPEPEPEPEPQVLLPELTTEDLWTVVNGSELVVAAEVLTVGAAPGRIEGPEAVQSVHYRVVEELKGSAPSAEIAVTHPVLRARPFVDEAAGALSAAHFEAGRGFILFLRREIGGGEAPRYRVWHDRFGTLRLDEATLADAREAVRAASRFGGGAGGDPFGRRRR